MELEKFVESIEEKLESNLYWQSLFDGYLKKITKIQDDKINNRKKFRLVGNLHCYSSISQEKNRFDIRYLGQSVATIEVNAGKVNFTPKKNLNSYFQGLENLKGCDAWNSEKGKQFRKYFKDMNENDVRVKSPEHRAESALLKEFIKATRKDKLLPNIQPVKLHNCFFQMPTPLAASGDDVNMSLNGKGGGIDMMARIKLVSGESRLTIFELKDETKKQETPVKVIRQAIAYSIFVAHLLKYNEEWWYQLGFSKEPKNKIINVATLMPFSNEFDGKSYENQIIHLKNGYRLELHSLFYENNHFSGSLVEIMKK